MKLQKALLMCGLLLGTLTGCTNNMGAIIKVNDEAITKAEFTQEYNRAISSPQYQMFGEDIKNPNSLISLNIKGRVINELIIKKMIDQEIKKRGIVVTKEEINAKKEEIIEKIGSKEKLETLMQETGVSKKTLDDDIAQEIKFEKLIASTKQAKVSEKEVKDFYNAHKKEFDYPERVRASHILIAVDTPKIRQEIVSQDKKGVFTEAEINKKVQEEVDKKMQLAKEVRAKAAANPSDFAKLAKEFSDDKTTAVNGGDLGYFARETMVKEFSDAAFKLKPGTVSEIVVTSFGNHIILVTDKASKGIQPYEKMKDEITVYLDQKKKIDTLTTLVEGLKSNSKIDFIDPEFDINKIEATIRNIGLNQAAPENKTSPAAKN